MSELFCAKCGESNNHLKSYVCTGKDGKPQSLALCEKCLKLEKEANNDG